MSRHANLYIVADVLGVPLADNGQNTTAEVTIHWGDLAVNYPMQVYRDVMEVRLTGHFVKFPGYVRGYLIVDTTSGKLNMRMFLYDGSYQKVADLMKKSVVESHKAIASFVSGCYRFDEPTKKWTKFLYEEWSPK